MKLKEGFVLREVAGSVVVLPTGGDLKLDMMITLNGTARFLWEKLEIGAEEEDLVRDMLAEYDCHITVRQGGQSYADATMHRESDYAKYQICSAHHDVLEQYAVFKEDFIQFAYALDTVECYAVFFEDDDKLAECKERVGGLEGISVAWSWPHCFEIFSVNAAVGPTESLRQVCLTCADTKNRFTI